jgi:geranylgeranyl diphosphate synthase type II
MKTEKSNENFVELRQYSEKYRPQIEKALREHLPIAPPNIETEFNEAIESAVFSGGNRLRPILTLLGAELFSGKAENILPSAVAVEFIYTSSLIFDDLPFMKNLENRHGKTSLHEKYGEDVAFLVALGLLNTAYSLVFVNHIGMPERALQAHAEIIECVGASGIIGGQSIDLIIAKNSDTLEFGEKRLEHKKNNNLKTSFLMRLALRVGAILAGADYLEQATLSRFAELLGATCQSANELIELTENSENFADDDIAGSQEISSAEIQLNNLVEETRRLLIENFSSNEARSCLIQLTEYLADVKA